MPQSLRNTWIAVILATLAVMGTGFFIVRTFVRDVFVECRGTLEQVPDAELGSNPTLQRVDRDDKNQVAESDLEIRFQEKKKKTPYDGVISAYTDVRVVWAKGDASCACGDISLKWNDSLGAPYGATIWRDKTTGLFVAYSPQYTHHAQHGITGERPLAVFRKSQASGHRFQMDRVFSPKHVSMLVFLLALGALGFAATRALRATPYATRMHTWRTATLRPEGFIESDTGATLGTLESKTRVPAGPVIVDPSAVEGRDIYREMPILGSRQVAAGSHERWIDGTMRRLRDARSIAILSTVTTGLALVAHVIS